MVLSIANTNSFVIVFNWIHFEMRLLNLRINFYLLQTFCRHLGSFVLFLLSLCFGQISPLAFSGDFPRPRIGMLSLVIVSPVSTVPGEHCQKIAVSNPTKAGQRFTWSKTWCDRQQLWKAVITGYTVTRLIIPIRGRRKSPEEGQR